MKYLLVLLTLSSCATTTIPTTTQPKDLQSQALEDLDKPFSLDIFQPVICKGKVIVVFEKLDQGPNVSYLDETGHWQTYDKKDCKDKNDSKPKVIDYE
jgi:hypothetical protein